jgi:hypothetical protein
MIKLLSTSMYSGGGEATQNNLYQILGTREGSKGSNPRSRSVHSRVADIEGPHDGGYLTVDHSDKRVLRVPLSLHSKDLFCRLRKKSRNVAIQKN